MSILSFHTHWIQLTWLLLSFCPDSCHSHTWYVRHSTFLALWFNTPDPADQSECEAGALCGTVKKTVEAMWQHQVVSSRNVTKKSHLEECSWWSDVTWSSCYLLCKKVIVLPVTLSVRHVTSHVPYNMDDFLFFLSKSSRTKKQTKMAERFHLYFRGSAVIFDIWQRVV